MTKATTKTIPVRYCLGIDISKKDLSVCFSLIDGKQQFSIKGTRTFANNSQGWNSLYHWQARFRKDVEVPFKIVMEATGVYYEGCAYFFRDKGLDVSVVLPNKAKHFARSLNIKTKTDPVDAQILARFGLERNLQKWNGLNPTMLKIKQLCRSREALIEIRTTVANQLHAHSFSSHVQKTIVKHMQQHIKFINKQIEDLEGMLHNTYTEDEDLKQRVENICTIKGVQVITALTVISEANAFELIENKSQLVSYAGYDVIESSSGDIKGRGRISKKGNSHIRRALYFPALVAATHDPKHQNVYRRICEKNPKVKKIGLVAVQRKLLVLIYTLYKKNEPYDPEYQTLKMEAAPKKSRQEQSLAYTA